MKRVRMLSSLLYNLSRVAALFVLAVVLYTGIALILNNAGISWAPVAVTNEQFTIYLPFTRTVFLLGDYTVVYLVLSLAALLLYGIFLWLLGRVFFVFMQRKIFIPENIHRLRNFYRFNLYAPLIAVMGLVVLQQALQGFAIIALLHLLLGVFLFFITTIFRQGLVLQEEQDQTL